MLRVLPLLLLVLLSQPLSAQPVTGVTQPAAPAAETAPAGDTLEDILPVLDRLSKEELLKGVNRVHNALSRDGQELLRTRARVRLIQQYAEDAVNNLKEDRLVLAADAVMKTPAAQTALATIRDIPTAEGKRKPFTDFLGTHKIKPETLLLLTDYLDAQIALENSERILATIDRLLARESIPPILLPPGTRSSGGLAAQLEDIEKRLDGEAPELGAGPAQVDGDVMDILIKRFASQPKPMPGT